MKQTKPFSTAATAFLVALSSVSSQGWSQPQDSVVGAEFKDCADCPTMIVIPAGSFTMGSPPHEEERDADEEGPQHTVTISRDFAVGKFEVTRGQYAAFVKRQATEATTDAAISAAENGRPIRRTVGVSRDSPRQATIRLFA